MDIMEIAAWIFVITTVVPFVLWLVMMAAVLIWVVVTSLWSKLKSWFE